MKMSHILNKGSPANSFKQASGGERMGLGRFDTPILGCLGGIE